MLTGLMYHRPEDPLGYLESCLQKARELGGPERVRWDTFITQDRRPLPPINRGQSKKTVFRAEPAPLSPYRRYERLPPIQAQFSIESDSDMTESTGLIQEYDVFDTSKPRPPIIFVVGGPGSGKGTQTAKMAQRYGYVCVSVGEILRNQLLHHAPSDRKWELEETCTDGSSDEIAIVAVLVSGLMASRLAKLLSQVECSSKGKKLQIDPSYRPWSVSRETSAPPTDDDEHETIIRKFYVSLGQETMIEELKQQFIKHQDAKGFIVDGFPREIAQAFTFEEQIGSPDLVVLLACSNPQLRQRLEKRASQQGRPDDNTHAIERRLETFKQNIGLIAKYYQERALVVRIDADREEGNIFTDISATVEERLFPKGIEAEAEDECLLVTLPQPAEDECLLVTLPQPAEDECLLVTLPQPAEDECLLVTLPQPAEDECLLVTLPQPAEDECLLVTLPQPAEDECLLVTLPQPAEDECLLSPSPPAEGECLLGLPQPAENECLLVSLPPPSRGEEQELPLPSPEKPGLDAGGPQQPLHSCSASPGVASCSASPGVASLSALPGVASRSASPGVASRSASPGVASRSASPGVASRSTSPGAASRSTSPGAAFCSTQGTGYEGEVELPLPSLWPGAPLPSSPPEGPLLLPSPGVARDPASPGVVPDPAWPGVARGPASPGVATQWPELHEGELPAMKKGGGGQETSSPSRISVAGNTVARAPRRGAGGHEEGGGGQETSSPCSSFAAGDCVVGAPRRGNAGLEEGGEVRRPASTAALSRQDSVWREPRKRELIATKKWGVEDIPPWPPPRNTLLLPLPGL
ncbi:UNVERIFIED_CONTAM: hypothetical protein FKN15_019230 [Acipenser sinensis]